MKHRPLTPHETEQLELSGNRCDDWSQCLVAEEFSPTHIRGCEFSGQIRLGRFERDYVLSGGMVRHSGLYNSRLHDCSVGDNCYISGIHDYIARYDIGHDTYIENTNTIVTSEPSTFGNGTIIPVMSESGEIPIPVYDKMPSTLAYLLATRRGNRGFVESVERQISAYAERSRSSRGTIGNFVRIINCGLIKNVRIGDSATIGGVSKLKDGSILSSVSASVRIGSGVKASDFIICSSTRIDDSTLLSRCFVGQGCIMSKHYSALDSLFFACSQGMHGEATSVFGGPFTVTHHKSTLLIAGMFSFLNAGSGSNQSNHLYKSGPVHYGIVERGSKTTSDSYILWPAHIGAFTLVMGRHTSHPDTADFPFSYLIENNGESYLVPAINLRSVGTVRDARKWPQRDIRHPEGRIDMINYNLLSPYTIGRAIRGRDTLQNLLNLSGDCPTYSHGGCIIRRSSLLRGIQLYDTAVIKFLGNSLISRLGERTYDNIDELRLRLIPDSGNGRGVWCDASGLICPESEVDLLVDRLTSGAVTLDNLATELQHIHARYYEWEWTWAYDRLLEYWGCGIDELTVRQIRQLIEQWIEQVTSLDRMLIADARREDSLRRFGSEWIAPDSNPFAEDVLTHIRRKTELGLQTLARLPE